MSKKIETSFVNSFYQFADPIPNHTSFSADEVKASDMKIILEISTRSYLRMQTDVKSKEISLSCKNYGKSCFQISAYFKDGLCYIKDDYIMKQHQRGCQLRNQGAQFLKIYNLMKLKKNLIQKYMKENGLQNSSPAQILTHISGSNQFYFFENDINYIPQLRRKLRKRFDNIINIDIKKITKEGRKKKNDYFSSQSQVDQRPFKKTIKKAFSSVTKNRKQKIIKKNTLFKKQKGKRETKQQQKKVTRLEKLLVDQFKLEIPQLKQEQALKEQKAPLVQEEEVPKSTVDIGIYFNSNSQSELKQIKELNQEVNPADDILGWSSSSQEQGPRFETINDKLRQDIFLSLRNSVLKRSLQTNSLSYFCQNGQAISGQFDDEHPFQQQNH